MWLQEAHLMNSMQAARNTRVTRDSCQLVKNSIVTPRASPTVFLRAIDKLVVAVSCK